MVFSDTFFYLEADLLFPFIRLYNTLSPGHVYIRFAFYGKSPYHMYMRLNIKGYKF